MTFDNAGHQWLHPRSHDLKEAVNFKGKWNLVVINEFMGTIIQFKCMWLSDIFLWSG